MSLPAELRRKLTYRYDLLRGAFGGILEMAAISFALLAAIRYFEASELSKSLLSAAFPIGLLVSPMMRNLGARLGWPASRICSVLLLLAAALFALAASAPGIVLFIVGFVGANILLAQQPTLFVAIYAQNYSKNERGSRVAHTFVLSALAGAVTSQVGGALLDRDPGYFSSIFLAMAASAAISALIVRRIPSEPVARTETGGFFNYGAASEDILFRRMLLAWMLLGLGNLMMIPLRVEYLANPLYGFNLSNEAIVFLTVLLFAVARIAGLFVFGRLFHRMSIIRFRNILNVFFVLGILLYFNSGHLWGIALGSLCFGFGMGGGNLAWSLWVTQVAPPGRSSEYMSIHSSLTGLRGVAAPFIGYGVLAIGGPAPASWLAMALIIGSMLLFTTVRDIPGAMERLAKAT